MRWPSCTSLGKGPGRGGQLLAWQGSLTQPVPKSWRRKEPGQGLQLGALSSPSQTQCRLRWAFRRCPSPSLVPGRMLRWGKQCGGPCPPPEKARSCVLSLSLILSRLEALRGPSITPGASRIKKGHWRFLNMDQKAVKCVLKKKSRH